MSWTRRSLLRTGAAALAAPFLPGAAAWADGAAQRVIFFYFPDGVPAWSDSGEPSRWHAWGSEHDPQLAQCLEPLAPFRDDCVFLNGLSMGSTDAGSHPGGAKKLLTAADHGNSESIDQYLARTIGAGMPWRHLYLGAQATADGASGDKHISYPIAGVSIPPEDDPRRAFESLFGFLPGPADRRPPPDASQASVLDAVIGDLLDLKARLGGTEAAKLDLHLEALREVEQRVSGTGGGGGGTGGGTGGTTGTGGGPISGVSCDAPSLATDYGELFAPESFPGILRAQIDLMVLAMACGMTKVGTLQGSMHTSELIMSRFEGTAMHDPGWDMRSHQASHYGASHSGREFDAFVQQRQWWVGQFAYLLQRLKETPEGDGTMLDHSLVVLCSEVCDGNNHLHDNMPFVLAGRAGGRVSTGRLLDVGYRRHGDLWVSVANALGDGIGHFGDASSGPIPGLVT